VNSRWSAPVSGREAVWLLHNAVRENSPSSVSKDFSEGSRVYPPKKEAVPFFNGVDEKKVLESALWWDDGIED